MMNYSRLVFVSVLLLIMVSLLAYNPVQADGVEVNNEAVSSHTPHGSFIAKKTAAERARRGVVYRLGLTCARGHAGHAASVAAAFLPAPLETTKSALATLASPPTAADASSLKFRLPQNLASCFKHASLNSSINQIKLASSPSC